MQKESCSLHIEHETRFHLCTVVYMYIAVVIENGRRGFKGRENKKAGD